MSSVAGELVGRIAIVTGSTRGLGRAIAEHFAEHGASVVIHGRDAAVCEQVAQGLPGSMAHPGDITASGFADSMVAATIERFGRIDILVNNAGVALDNFVTGVTDERWAATMATNLTAPFATLRAATRAMKGTGGGAVLNVVSWAGERGNVGQIAYSASKGALASMTLSAAKELGKFGIRVNALSPAVATAMTEVMVDRLKQAAASRRPLKIEGTALDVAEGALFLCSDRARFITGETLHVDGGLHLS